VKLNIIPLCMCSAMWQCAIHRPGLLTSNRMSTVWSVRISTVSFHTRFGSTLPSRARTRNRPAPVEMERVMHGMVGFHLVDQPDLDPLSDAEPPVDCRAVHPSGAIEEPPVHGRIGARPIDLDHVVFPLDPVGGAMPSVIAMVGVMVGRWPAGRLDGE
jgi:hypothetical protein